MENYLVQLITANPWTIWAGLLLIGLAFGFAIVQNREFGLFGFRFGAKPPPPPPLPRIEHKVSTSAQQTVPIHIYAGPEISEEQYEKIYRRVKARLESDEHRKIGFADLLNLEPQPTERHRRIFAARYAVRRTYLACEAAFLNEPAARDAAYMVYASKYGYWVFIDYGLFLEKSLAEDLQVFEHQVDSSLLGSEVDDTNYERLMVMAADLIRRVQEAELKRREPLPGPVPSPTPSPAARE